MINFYDDTDVVDTFDYIREQHFEDVSVNELINENLPEEGFLPNWDEIIPDSPLNDEITEDLPF